MGYQIRVAPEAEKWAARLNAYVLSAWRSLPVPPGEASRMLGKIGFWIAQPGLDAAYKRHLVELRRSRRAVADVATWCKRLELQIADLERQADTAQDAAGQLAELRRRYAGMQAKKERLTEASRRLMAEINAFHTSMETTKTANAAAEQAARALRAEVTGSPGATEHTDGSVHTSEP